MNRKLIPRATLTSWTAPGIVCLVMGAVLLSGCGGGDSHPGGGNLGSGNNGVEQSFGRLTTRVVGTAQPPVISNGTSAGVTGIAGASFTSLILNRSLSAPTLADNTRIVYQAEVSPQHFEVFTIPLGGGTPTQITDGKSVNTPTWSRDGTRIAYSATDGQIYTVPANGGTPTQITSDNLVKYDPSWSPDSTRIVFRGIDSSNSIQLYTVPASGGTPTQITTGNPAKFSPAWSPDGSKIVYQAGGQFYTVPSGGGTSTQITTGTNVKSSPAWSPDGSKIAFQSIDSTQTSQIFTMPSGGGASTPITSGGGDKDYPSWSPDGTQIAYSVDNAQIFTIPASGGTPTQITTGAQVKLAPSWSPFLMPSPVTLLGSDGLLGKEAAGFLFAQSGDKVQSVLVFDTATATPDSRGAGRVAAVTPVDTNNPNLIFTLTANDSLSRVAYLAFDSTSGVPDQVIAPSLPAGTTGALVSFNAATGKVVAVLPYGANRSASGGSAPKVVRQGSALVVQGRFLAVFDAAGKNQAANGAREVRLNLRTGELISLN